MALLLQHFIRLTIGEPYAPGEDMKYEFVRLQSYKNFPKSCSVRPITLAKAGFFYTGNAADNAADDDDDDDDDEDEPNENHHPGHLVCFCCGWKIEISRDVDYLTIQTQHGDISPQCDLLKDPNVTDNVIIPLARDLKKASSLPYTTHQLFQKDKNKLESLQAVGHGSNANDSYSHERSEFLSLTYDPSNPLDSQALSTSLPPNQPDCVSYSKSEGQMGLLQSTPKMYTHHGNMSHEHQRLQSFVNWPANSPVTPIDLAGAGFYYHGVVDRVRCAFCGLVLFGWEEGDHPMKEHERLGPACRFVGLQKTTDVVHASGQVLTLGAQLNDSQTGMRNCQPNVGIGTECVKYPYYALESHRLKTFDKWPFFVEQQPEALAKAGFYSVRVSDRVKCFFCDGGLRNWEYGDEPWTVHARWFPNCGFLLKIQGETFVQQVQNRYNPGVTAIAAPTSGVRTAINQPGEASAGPNPPMAFNDVENMAIEMGFGKENVRRVMKHKIFTAGTFSDFEALLAVLLVTNSNEDTSREPNKHIGKEEHVKVNEAAAPENSDTEENDEKPPAKSKNQRKKQRRKQNKVAAIAESASKLTDRPGGLSQPEHGEKVRDDNMQSMIEENKQLKDLHVCKVCMDNEVSMVFLPCGHLVCCSSCAQALQHCPICRGLIRGTVRTFVD